MNSITRHIEYLILRHDCVIVPELGAFIAHYTPAEIDESTGVINPPSRALSFNSDVTHNDGLLASSIARDYATTFDRAIATIAEQVAALKSQIAVSGEFAVGRLGILKQNVEGNLEFEPFTATAISPRLVGLPSFKLQPLHVTTDNTGKKQKRALILNSAKIALRAAASVAVLVGLGLMLSTPVIEHSPEMAAFTKNFTSTKTATEKIVIKNAPQILSFALPENADAVAIVTPKEKSETQLSQAVATPATTADKDRYFLIVASLPTQSKAEEYIAERHDSNLTILHSDNRYRIYVASGKSYREVHSILSIGDNAQKYPDAWVLHH